MKMLTPNVWLKRAPLAAVWVGPNLKLHLSAFSWPLTSNQALRSGSVMASSDSCVITLIMPSAPPPLPGVLLGPVAWISHPLGQRSELPMNAHLMSAPLSVWFVWKPQNDEQNPCSLMLDEVRNR